MATSCQDVSARLVELLYEELPAEERAAMEGHVAGCASCRAELEGFNQTRKLAHQVIGEPVPRRAHAAIMDAAAAHLASAPKQEQRERTAARQSAGPRTSLWEWIRTRWTLPTLATVGAVAVFLLASKVFMDPKRTYERGREIAADRVTVPSTPPPAATVPAPELAGKSSADRSEERLKGKVAAEEQERGRALSARTSDKRPAVASGSGSSGSGAGLGVVGGTVASEPTAPARRRFAPPPPPKAASAERAPAKPAAAKPAEWVADDESTLAKEAPASPRKREMAPQESSRKDIAQTSAPDSPQDSDDEAASEMDEGRAARTRQAGEMASGAGPRGGMPGPAAAPPPAPPASATASRAEPEKKSGAKKKADSPAPAARLTAAPTMDSLASSTSSKGAKGGGSTTSAVTETPVQRADRLFAQGRWLAAAQAYRELLRQEPRNTDAARWRQRLTLSEARLEAEREAPTSAPAK